MKSLLILTTAVILSGCMNLTFDGGEYDRLITLKETVDLTHSACNSPNVKELVHSMKVQSDHEYMYSGYRKGGRPQIAKVAGELKTMIDNMHAMYESDKLPSVEYCKQKTDNISAGTHLLLQEIGKL